MIIRRILDALRKPEWGTALIEFLIVVIGIFLGLQISNWNEDRKAEAEGHFYLDLLRFAPAEAVTAEASPSRRLFPIASRSEFPPPSGLVEVTLVW